MGDRGEVKSPYLFGLVFFDCSDGFVFYKPRSFPYRLKGQNRGMGLPQLILSHVHRSGGCMGLRRQGD